MQELAIPWRFIHGQADFGVIVAKTYGRQASGLDPAEMNINFVT